MILSRAYVLNLCPPGIAGSFAAVMFVAPNVGQVTGPIAAGGISGLIGDAACVTIMAICYGVPTLLLFPFPPRSIEELQVGKGITSAPAPPFDRANSLIVESNLDQGTTVTYERLEDNTLVPRTFTTTTDNNGHDDPTNHDPRASINSNYGATPINSVVADDD